MTRQDSGKTDGRVLKSDPKLYAILGLAGAGVLSSTLVSPALPGMASAFELTEARVGMVMTAFYLTAVVAIPTVGAATDMWGRRKVFLGSLVVYGVAGVLIVFSDMFAVVLLLRAIQGCAFPGLIPMAITLIGDLYDGTVATTAQGYLTSTTGIGGIVPPLVAGALVDISWRLPFWLYGVSFVAFVLCYLWLPEPDSSPNGGTSPSPDTADTELPDVGRSLDPTERADIPDPSTDKTTATTISTLGSKAKLMLREVGDGLTREAGIVIFAVIVLFFVRYALFTFIPLYAVNVLETTELVGGVAVAVLGLGRFIAAPLAGRLAAHVTRSRVLISSLLCFGVGTWALLLTTDPWVVVAILGVASVGDGLFDPIANDMVTMSAPANVRGRIVSVLEVGKTGAIAVSPIAFGLLLSTSSYAMLFLTGGTLMAVTAVIVWVVLAN